MDDLIRRHRPTFATKAEERQHRKERLAAAFRISRAGFEEGVAGHITARDPEDPHRFWVNPFAVPFSQIKASDLICVDADGEVVEGRHPVNRAAFAIHSQVHLARPDVVAAAHTHSLHGKALSALHTTLLPLTQDACAFYGQHSLFDDYTGVVLDPEEGKRIAHALGDNKAVILANHGLLTVGTTVDSAAWWFMTMERSCQAQLLATAAGTPVPIDHDMAVTTNGQTGSEYAGWLSFQALYDRIVAQEPDLLASAPLRVVQWATGNIGTRSLRGIIGHPGLELVGVLVHDPAKAGVDAGELCGEAPTGVRATTDPADVLALRPDCVVHMASSCDVDAVTTLLAAGIDVVSTRGELTGDGAGLSATDRERVLKACAEGGSSDHATGSSPGFITEVLPMAVLSIQRRVDLVAIDEFADLAHRDSPDLLFRVMGFGGSPESFSDARAQHLLASFQPSLEQLALAAGFAVDRWTAAGETAVAARDTTIAAGLVPAGTVAAQRTRLVGWVGEREAVTFTATWYAVADLEPAWNLGLTGWRLAVLGDAPLVLDLPFPAKGEDLAAATPGYTANRAVNVIPWVCAAAPGFVRTRDLPAVTPVGPSV